MQDILDAGGKLDVEWKTADQWNRLNRQIDAASRFPQVVPPGLHFLVDGPPYTYSRRTLLLLDDAGLEHHREKVQHWLDNQRAQREKQRAERHAQRLTEDREKVLARRVDKWADRERARPYLAALEAAVGELSGDERAEAEPWLGWVRSHLAERMPRELRVMPEPPRSAG